MIKTIPKVGKIIIEKRIKRSGRGADRTASFLDEFIEAFAKKASAYILDTHEAPFAYRERQLHSIVLPALDKICSSVLMETPINRKVKNSENETHNYLGWMDYWCHKNAVEYFIEVKHSYASFYSGKMRDVTQNRWDTANEQIKSAKKNAKELCVNTSDAFSIALFVIPVYIVINSKEVDPVKKYFEKCQEIFKIHINEFNTKPNWGARWQLHDDLFQMSHQYHDNDKLEYYPELFFFANVEKIK